MKSYAITGASGFIGRSLVSKLSADKNIKIKVLSRQESGAHDFPDEVDVINGDLLDKESLGDFLESNCVVINLVYLWNGGLETNLEAVKNLVAACNKAGVAQLIHCSTAAVVGRASENVITENTKCRPVTEYGITKLRVEQEIFNMANESYAVSILRPTSVFGPGGEPLKKLIHDLRNGGMILNYLKSCLFSTRRMNLVHIDNVIASILFVANNMGLTDREIFIISDDDCVENNFKYIEDSIIEHINKGGYLLPRLNMPLIILKYILLCLGRNSINPYGNYSAQKIINAGFDKPTEFKKGISGYIDWYFSKYSSD